MPSKRTTRHVHKELPTFYTGNLLVNQYGDVFMKTDQGIILIHDESNNFRCGIAYVFENEHQELCLFKGKVILSN